MIRIKAGAARVTITPPVGVELSGNAFGPSVGILGDLEAQALVLEVDGEWAVLLTADLIGFRPALVAAVRRRIKASVGIPNDRVLLAGSHTHSGPGTIFLRHWGAFDEGYLSVLEDQLVGLVTMAHRNVREARMGTALGHVDNISENRRIADGPIDPDVPVVRFDDLEGQPIAVLYNYACHPVSLHSYRCLISPDYPGYARSVIQGVLGSEVVVMFMLGAAGDINPKGFVARQTTPERSGQIGAILGCEVAKVALGIESQEETVLRMVNTTVDLPVEALPSVSELGEVKRHFEAQVAQRRTEKGSRGEIAHAAIMRDWAQEGLEAWERGEVRRSRPCEIQGIRLGDAVIVALPLEVFVETGLAIKQEIGKGGTDLGIISSNSNGALGYLPTAHVYQLEQDYAGPRGLAPKVYDLYTFSSQAEPLLCQEAIELVTTLV